MPAPTTSRNARPRETAVHVFVMALAICVLTAGPAAASDQAEVTSVVREWADGFNKADTQLVAASCADQAFVVDDFPPHEWNGGGACVRWLTDFQAFATRAEISDAVIAVGKPGHVDVTGDV